MRLSKQATRPQQGLIFMQRVHGWDFKEQSSCRSWCLVPSGCTSCLVQLPQLFQLQVTSKAKAAPPRWVVAPGAAWHCHICMSPAGVTSPSASSTAVTKQGHLHAAMVCKPWLALLAECHRRTNAERTRCCDLSYTVSIFSFCKGTLWFPRKKGKKKMLCQTICANSHPTSSECGIMQRLPISKLCFDWQMWIRR